MVPHGPHTLGGPVVPRGAVLYPGISFTYELEVTSSTSVPGVYNVAFVSGQRFKGRSRRRVRSFALTSRRGFRFTSTRRRGPGGTPRPGA